MSLAPESAFRFATEAQWNSCLFLGADRSSAEGRTGLRPYAPYAVPPALFRTAGAFAPVMTDICDMLWRDEDGLLQRLPYGEEQPRAVAVPAPLAAARRMVATLLALWAVGPSEMLQAFDTESLTRILTVDLPGHRFLDIATDGHRGLYALTASAKGRHVVHVDAAGGAQVLFRLDGADDARALAILGHSARIVVLTKADPALIWFDLERGEWLSRVSVSTLRGCFEPTVLGGDGCTRLFLGGVDGAPSGGRAQLLPIDADGGLLGAVAFDGEPTGIAPVAANVYVTTGEGLLRFDPATTIPAGGEITATVLTPTLASPANTPRRWTRIDAELVLPVGCTIEIEVAATDEPSARDEIALRLADRAVPARARLADWRRDIARAATYRFHGDVAEAGRAITVSVPLHDIRAQYLWVEVSLIASPGGQVPILKSMAVRYPGSTLISYLPAVYRRGELESGDFLQGLVGVLEASTQNLDAEIANMGRHIHPATAGPEWLDQIARWMGLPWDDALSDEQKRRIAGSGAALTRGYGTRAGLEVLLDCIMAEQPRRYRIVDMTADYGLVTLGGDACAGSRLPAILDGLPRSALELGVKATLGAARLPCGVEPLRETARLTGRIRIDLAVDSAERRAWSPWLDALVAAMLPATVRAELRWLGRNMFTRSDVLGDPHLLDDDPVARLGTDAVTGHARLGGISRTRLPHRSGDHPLH